MKIKTVLVLEESEIREALVAFFVEVCKDEQFVRDMIGRKETNGIQSIAKMSTSEVVDLFAELCLGESILLDNYVDGKMADLVAIENGQGDLLFLSECVMCHPDAIMLFRCDRGDSCVVEEFEAAKQHFTVIESRSKLSLHARKTVVARYAALPYYKELETDCEWFDCKLINSYEQHLWIANFEYYEPLKKYTPETWDEHNFSKWDYEGPFIVKGKTNSRKHRWNKDMFAADRRRALEIASTLHNDMWLCYQDIIFRKYVSLKTFEIGLFDLPFTNEWRFFYYKGERVAYDYYWSIADKPELGTMNEEGLAFADKVAAIAADYANFYVLDIAEKEEGGWILIEINDGQMSGLSMIDPYIFYENLAKILKEN